MEEEEKKCHLVFHKKPTLQEINELILYYCEDWHRVGLFLGMSSKVMRNIGKFDSIPTQCFEAMFSKWLNHEEGTGDKVRTWGTVLTALEDTGRVDVATGVLEEQIAKHGEEALKRTPIADIDDIRVLIYTQIVLLWRVLGLRLGISEALLSAIESEARKSICSKQAIEMFRLWLDGVEGTGDQDRYWSTILKVLIEIGRSEVSMKVLKHFDPSANDIAIGRYLSLSQESLHNGMEVDGEVKEDKLSGPVNWSKGKYLRAGANAKVFLCHDYNVGRTLAVKIVDIHPNSDPTTQKNVIALEREIQVLKHLRHERIVTYFGTACSNSQFCIFTEYMAGGSILQHLERVGAFNEALTCKYTKQILQGLSYLHGLKIVHRDIKGANILRDCDGNVKLADFGTSKQLQTITGATQTFLGTPHWMAPEVILGSSYTTRADIWSVGCTIVEMLTCHPPLHDLDPVAAMFRIGRNQNPPDLPPQCSEHAKAFLNKCFVRDEASRCSASELLELLFVNP